MKEYISVEFIAYAEDREALFDQLEEIREHFIPSNGAEDYHTGNYQSITIVSGRISSEAASLIKLQNKFLSERMRVSFIPDSLKDKYRK